LPKVSLFRLSVDSWLRAKQGATAVNVSCCRLAVRHEFPAVSLSYCTMCGHRRLGQAIAGRRLRNMSPRE